MVIELRVSAQLKHRLEGERQAVLGETKAPQKENCPGRQAGALLPEGPRCAVCGTTIWLAPHEGCCGGEQKVLEGGLKVWGRT